MIKGASFQAPLTSLELQIGIPEGLTTVKSAKFAVATIRPTCQAGACFEFYFMFNGNFGVKMVHIAWVHLCYLFYVVQQYLFHTDIWGTNTMSKYTKVSRPSFPLLIFLGN